MNVVRKKLNNARGASMLIALIYLLTALMVGTVVLTAASSNVGRITHNRQDQREYYAVESAMELVRADMENAEFTGSYQKTVTVTYYPEEINEDGEVTKEAYTDSDTDYGGFSVQIKNSSFLNTSGQKADFYNLYGSTVPVSTGLHLDAPVSMEYALVFETSAEMPTVKGKMTVDISTYDITVMLWSTHDSDDSSKSNPVTMIYPASGPEKDADIHSRHSDGQDITSTVYTTTVTWGKPSIMKGVSE